MCLAIPGKVISIDRTEHLITGMVSFGGIKKQICLDWVPEVKVGDYILAHVGFALNIVDEEEALATLDILRQTDEIAREFGLQSPEPPAPAAG